jgi:hypothetical protein
MARKKSILNQAGSEVIEKNFLEPDPEGFKPMEAAEKEITGVVPVPAHQNLPKMEKVIFLNGRDPGVALHFHYHSKTHPLKHYTLFHGKEHLLSEEIIDHLESCAERQYAYRQGPDGSPEHYVKSLKYIFQCRRSGDRQYARTA